MVNPEEQIPPPNLFLSNRNGGEKPSNCFHGNDSSMFVSEIIKMSTLLSTRFLRLIFCFNFVPDNVLFISQLCWNLYQWNIYISSICKLLTHVLFLVAHADLFSIKGVNVITCNLCHIIIFQQ